jgi:hypothetical protein
VESHRCFCISAKTFHLNFNEVKPINTRNTRSRVAISYRFFGVISETLPLPSSVSPRFVCAQVQRPCSSSWRSVCVLWACHCYGPRWTATGRQPSRFVANNETLQQVSAQKCSSGWDRGHPLLFFLFLQILHKSLLFECTQMARKHRVALEAEEAVCASAHRYVPSIPTCLRPVSKKRFTNAPSHHGRMRKCEGTSKATMKAKRAHAEI